MPYNTIIQQSLFEVHRHLFTGTEKACESKFRETQTYLTKLLVANAKAYNPSAPEDIPNAMADLIDYINSNDIPDILISAAMVHYQFETIHPFEYGNGFIGRLLIQIMLKSSTPHFPFHP